MLFHQLFDKNSSTYTYLIASAKGREALIIDPVLENIEQYKIIRMRNLHKMNPIPVFITEKVTHA